MKSFAWSHCVKQKIRDGITRLLEENVGKENYDGNRLEQELIYYIEKIDISEEQVRLRNHCDYFWRCLQKQRNQREKLSFILRRSAGNQHHRLQSL